MVDPSIPAQQTVRSTVSIEEISSPSNQRIKAASSLRDVRERRESGLMIIDGDAVVRHAVAGGIEIVELFFVQTLDESHRLLIAQWQELAPTARINLVARPAMAKLQYGGRDESVIAVARQPTLALETLDERTRTATSKVDVNKNVTKCYLVLDQIEKPGNLGAVLRTADAAGVEAVLLSDPVSETWNPNAIRASLGAIFRVPLAVGSASQVQRWLTDRSIALVAARVDAAQSHIQIQFAQQVAIVVGNESLGLGPNWSQPSVQAVRIPMFGAVDSLNVSVSTSIILFELLRQHGRLNK
ncbi:MAG: TrmH family RNA methyltransferase [Pirellula sp.]